jgi:sulfatase maturation enzyme AslB (radical SAM superfamily)
LIKENRTLLRKLLDNGNKDCFVSFTTNGTQADSELLELLKEFPNNEIQISIDGVADQAHYIRYPTVWEEFKDNVDKLCSIPNVNIVFYTVVSAYNLFSIQEILKYVDSIAKDRKVGWYPIFLDNPDYLHTYVWPKQRRELAKIKLTATVMRLEHLTKYVSKDVFAMLEQYIVGGADQSYSLDYFKKFNNTLDSKRGTDFNKTFPELCLD